MAETRPVIGIDLDDVLLDIVLTLGHFHNDQYGTSLTFDKWTTFDLEVIFGCSIEEKDRRVKEFFNSDHYERTLPTAGAIQAIEFLRKSYSLHIVTARPAEMRLSAERLIDRHFPGCFEEIHFTGSYVGDAEMRRSKAHTCREIGVVAFIDDALHNVIDVASIGCSVFLLDKPWNQGLLPSNVTRVTTWNEIVEHLSITG